MDLCFGFFCFSFVASSVLLLLFFCCSVKRGLGSKRRYCFVPGNMNIIMHILVERLRPLVGLKGWDYCAMWKLSEDQRFIERMDCCCAGTDYSQNAELHFPVSPVLPCRDTSFQHPRTNSCDLLAQLPSSLPLDSGIFAQTLISNKPSWLNFSNNTESSVPEESTAGTRVLIPLAGGVLIELFASKQVAEDQQVIDLITAQCNISVEQEALISSNMDTNFSENVNAISEIQSKPFLNDGNDPKDPSNHFQPRVSPATPSETLSLPYDIYVDRIRLCDSPMNFLQQFNYNSEDRSKNDIYYEGSHNSFASDKPTDPIFKSSSEKGCQLLDMDALQQSMMNSSPNMHMQFVEPLLNKEQQGNDKDSKHERGRTDSVSDCSDQFDDEEDAKYRRRTGKGAPQSKNLVAERKRRKKLNDRLYALRALVPKISKLDRASILGDAIEFVKELKKQEKELQDELEEHSDDGGRNTVTDGLSVQSEILNQINGINVGPRTEHDKSPNGIHMRGSDHGMSVCKQDQGTDNTNDKAQQMEPQVEVAQIDGNEFFVKVFCEHKPGGFVRLMEALNSLGLEVTNANVTSFRGLVSNVFKVEKRDSEIVQADHVRDSLLELTRDPSRGWPEMAKESESCVTDYNPNYQQHLHNHHASSCHHRSLHHLHN